jgi:predicted PurR-regulated permease PerM
MFSKFVYWLNIIAKLLENISNTNDLVLFLEIHSIVIMNIIDQITMVKNTFEKSNEPWSGNTLTNLSDDVIKQLNKQLDDIPDVETQKKSLQDLIKEIKQIINNEVKILNTIMNFTEYFDRVII